MAYKGKFRPHHPEKYQGNPTNIIYRSLWELKFMRQLDADPRILSWSSEEFFIPYHDPSTGRKRRYFPDFRAKTQNKTMVFEIKPYHQTIPPVITEKTKTKPNQYFKQLKAATTYMTNKAKWEACEKYCKENGWEFKILTENELGIP